MAMTLATLSQKISWRLVAVHLVAIFFLVMASKQLGVLNNLALLDSVDKYGIEEGMKQWEKAGDFAGRSFYFNAWIVMSASIGVLLGVILSATIIVKRKLHWLNIVVVIIPVIIIGQSGLYQNAFIERIINLPGFIVMNAELKYRHILTGIIPLVISLLLFFNKRINNSIKGQQTSAVSSSVPATDLV